MLSFFSFSCLWAKLHSVSESLGPQFTWGHTVHNRSHFFLHSEITKFRSAITCFLVWCCCAGHGLLRGRRFPRLTARPLTCARTQTCRWKKQHLLKRGYNPWTVLHQLPSLQYFLMLLSSLQDDARNVDCGESMSYFHSKDSTQGLSLLHKLHVTRLLDQAACREQDVANCQIEEYFPSSCLDNIPKCICCHI